MANLDNQPVISYSTELGMMVESRAEDALCSPLLEPYLGEVQLLFTSPPFPLNREKAYGNREGSEYENWLADFASQFRRFLKPDGSIVIEMGNSWKSGEPAMSTLGLRSLLSFLERGEFGAMSAVCLSESREITLACPVGKCRAYTSQGCFHSYLVDVTHNTTKKPITEMC